MFDPASFVMGVSSGSLITILGFALIIGSRSSGGCQPVKGKPLGPPPGYKGKWPL